MKGKVFRVWVLLAHRSTHSKISCFTQSTPYATPKLCSNHSIPPSFNNIQLYIYSRVVCSDCVWEGGWHGVRLFNVAPKLLYRTTVKHEEFKFFIYFAYELYIERLIFMIFIGCWRILRISQFCCAQSNDCGGKLKCCCWLKFWIFF